MSKNGTNDFKKIQSNPGGIILDYKENNFSMPELEEVIRKRLSVSAKCTIDIMIIKNGKTIKIIRYKK